MNSRSSIFVFMNCLRCQEPVRSSKHCAFRILAGRFDVCGQLVAGHSRVVVESASSASVRNWTISRTSEELNVRKLVGILAAFGL